MRSEFTIRHSISEFRVNTNALSINKYSTLRHFQQKNHAATIKKRLTINQSARIKMIKKFK